MPWLESLAVLTLLLLTGSALPRLAGSRGWLAAWLVALLLVVLLGAQRRYPALDEAWPLSYLTAGRTEYVLYGPLTLLLLGLPILHSTHRAIQAAAATFALLVVWVTSLAPFLGPVLYAPPRARLTSDGICLQSDGFSCGPAAAVTALTRLGLSPDFSSLARAAHTSPVIGTPPDLLCQALQSLYPVTARRLYLDHLEQLPPGQALLLVNHSPWTDHYLSLVSYSPSEVLVVDPLRGPAGLRRADFERRWRHLAIIITPRD